MQITQELINRIDELLEHGLVRGLGVQEPGKMCVEALVCHAMEQPHSARPDCVGVGIRGLAVILNDALWPSNQARARGLRRLAILQLGTSKDFSTPEFARRFIEFVDDEFPRSYKTGKDNGEIIVNEFLSKVDRDWLYAAACEACTYAAIYANHEGGSADAVLTKLVAGVEKILIDMEVPGADWV